MNDTYPAGMMVEWEQFLSQDRSLADLFSSENLFPLQRQKEMEKMHTLSNTIQPTTLMEIGLDKGGSGWAWLKALPSLRRVIACEIRGTPYCALFERAFPDIDFLWMPSSSRDPFWLEALRGWLGKDRIDILFLDGDKNAFEQDFNEYLPKMSPSGIVFFHDIQDASTGDAFRRVKKNVGSKFRSSEIIDISDSLTAMDREKRGIPASCAHEGWLREWKGRSCGVGVIELGGQK